MSFLFSFLLRGVSIGLETLNEILALHLASTIVPKAHYRAQSDD
jgi:hypothetical protein